MKRALIALALVACVAATLATATAVGDAPAAPAGKGVAARCTAQAFRPFSSAVWNPKHWQQATPKQPALDAYHARLACAPPGHREAMLRTWLKDRARFYVHRRTELAWARCPDSIRTASRDHRVWGWLLYGIEGAESGWGSGGSNLFGLLEWGGATSDPYASAEEAARLMRQLHDEMGSWEAAMFHYSGGGYGLAHPMEMNGGTCP